jgi:RNA polymerase sigma factor (sigma-70 family)
MGIEGPQEKAFALLLDQFACFIRFHIQKFDVQKFGLDPEDISQDVRIRIWKLMKSEKTITNYASYIKKIVNSAVIDRLRRWRREEGVVQEEKSRQIAEYENIYHPDLEKRDRLKEVLAEAVETLIDSRRQVVKLYLLNMSVEDISRYLRFSQDKTRNLLYRGLADLKRFLHERSGDDLK